MDVDDKWVHPTDASLSARGGTRLIVWVIDEEIDTGLERHLLETVLEWVESDWPFDRVLLSLREANTCVIALCEALSLKRCRWASRPGV